MQITINVTPEEIAALAPLIQGPQVDKASVPLKLDGKVIYEAIRDTYQASSLP